MLISELPIGAKIREPLSGLVFQVCAQNHPDYPGTALILDTVLKQRCLDAREPGSSEDQRKYGNNTFYQSNLCMWLNSDAISDWYTPGHASDAPPSAENVYDCRTAYEMDRGFLATLSRAFRSALVTCQVPCLTPQPDGSARLDHVPLRVFLPSIYEIGFANGTETQEGTLLPLFRDFRNRIAAPDPSAFGIDDRLYFHRGANYWYWLRTPVDGTDCLTWRTQHGLGYGLNIGDYPCYGHTGVRPMVVLESGTSVSPSPDEFGVYRLFDGQKIPIQF